MKDVKVRLEFLLVDISNLKKIIFEKTEQELQSKGRTDQYYVFCVIEENLIKAKNYAEAFLAKYAETTEEADD